MGREREESGSKDFATLLSLQNQSDYRPGPKRTAQRPPGPPCLPFPLPFSLLPLLRLLSSLLLLLSLHTASSWCGRCLAPRRDLAAFAAIFWLDNLGDGVE